MTRREPPPVTAGCIRAEVGRRSTWLWGPGTWQAAGKVGSPRQWCTVYHTTTVPNTHSADVLAYLEYRDRRHVIVVAVDR